MKKQRTKKQYRRKNYLTKPGKQLIGLGLGAAGAMVAIGAGKAAYGALTT